MSTPAGLTEDDLRELARLMRETHARTAARLEREQAEHEQAGDETPGDEA